MAEYIFSVYDCGTFHYVYVPQFFIHSSVKGHLGDFHVLAIVNSAAVNNGIHVCFSILVSSRYIPRSGIAGSYGGLNPSFFQRISIPTFREDVSIYIPIKSTKMFPFLHILSSVFPVVMYGCENWTIKKAEHQEVMLLYCGVGEDSWEPLGL